MTLNSFRMFLFGLASFSIPLSSIWGQSAASSDLRPVERVLNESLFKRVPTPVELAPAWAQRMYAGDMNYREIVQEREDFLRGKPYEKTIHERNFKHWLMQVEHRVDENGLIQPAGAWAQVQWDGAPNVNAKQQDTESIWQPIGPMETYNAGSEGGIPVSWQCNVYCFDQSSTNPNICVAGVEAGDLFKTVDQGLTWHAVTEGVPGIRTVRAVKIAPSDPNRIYFEANQTLYGSLDGGTTWDLLHNLGACHANRRSPFQPQRGVRFGMERAPPHHRRWCDVDDHLHWHHLGRGVPPHEHLGPVRVALRFRAQPV